MGQPQGRHFSVSLSPEIEVGVYADFVSVWHTEDAFVLDFAALTRPPEPTEQPGSGQQVLTFPTRIVSRVRVPPGQVFEIMKALERQLSAWERETGRKAPEPPEE